MTDKQRFWKLLDGYPYLKRYWSRTGTGELKTEAALNAMHGRKSDAVLLGCLASIWLGGIHSETCAAFRIDFTDLYAYTDPHDRQPLIDWLTDPYWP